MGLDSTPDCACLWLRNLEIVKYRQVVDEGNFAWREDASIEVPTPGEFAVYVVFRE